MNEQEYMNITSKIDEQYVNEYKVIEAKHNITMRKRIRTAILVAAAVAIMIPVSVFAHRQLTHRDKVSIYYGEEGAEMMEKNLLDSGYTVENGKIRLTVDVQMCDGNYTEFVYTLTALTEDAKDHIKTHDILLKRIYVDTGEWIVPAQGSGYSLGDAENEYEITWNCTYAVNEPYVDNSRPTRLQFVEWVSTGESDGHGGYFTEEDYTYYEGIYIDLLSEPNVPTKTLRSPDGKEFTLSPYGISRLDADYGEGVPSFVKEVTVISTDGERIPIYSAGPLGGIDANGGITITSNSETTISVTGSLDSGDFTLRFGRVFNIDNISGVEINGVKYMAE